MSREVGTAAPEREENSGRRRRGCEWGEQSHGEKSNEGDPWRGPDAGEVPPLLRRPLGHPRHQRPPQPYHLHAWLHQAPPSPQERHHGPSGGAGRLGAAAPLHAAQRGACRTALRRTHNRRAGEGQRRRDRLGGVPHRLYGRLRCLRGHTGAGGAHAPARRPCPRAGSAALAVQADAQLCLPARCFVLRQQGEGEGGGQGRGRDVVAATVASTAVHALPDSATSAAVAPAGRDRGTFAALLPTTRLRLAPCACWSHPTLAPIPSALPGLCSTPRWGGPPPGFGSPLVTPPPPHLSWGLAVAHGATAVVHGSADVHAASSACRTAATLVGWKRNGYGYQLNDILYRIRILTNTNMK